MVVEEGVALTEAKRGVSQLHLMDNAIGLSVNVPHSLIQPAKTKLQVGNSDVSVVDIRGRKYFHPILVQCIGLHKALQFPTPLHLLDLTGKTSLR